MASRESSPQGQAEPPVPESAEALPQLPLRTYIENRDTIIRLNLITVLDNGAQKGNDPNDILDEAFQYARSDWDDAIKDMPLQTQEALNAIRIVIPPTEETPGKTVTYAESQTLRDKFFQSIIGMTISLRDKDVSLHDVLVSAFADANKSWNEVMPQAVTDAYDQISIPVLRAPADTNK